MERLMVLEIAFWMYINGSLEELSWLLRRRTGQPQSL